MSVDIEKAAMDFVEQAEKNHANPGATVYSTGYYDLDERFFGFPKSQLTILAGRHSMGKTSFALNIATNLAKNGQKVLFVSCEMDEKILFGRIVTAEVEVEMMRTHRGELHTKEWEKICSFIDAKEFKKLKENLVIEPSFTGKFDKLANIVNEFAQSNPDSIVIIDYFQLLNRQGATPERYMELADLASSIKRLAVANNVHIILLSQISRKVEERPDKRPVISDLAECDALSQHSDNIIFIHREEYWNKENCENKNMATIIINKIKNNAPSEFELLFQGSIMKFKNRIKPQAF